MKLRATYKPKKHLVGFPNKILIAINNECIKQGNSNALSKIDQNIYLSRLNGGFDWHKTKNNKLFWKDIMINKNFNEFKNYIK